MRRLLLSLILLFGIFPQTISTARSAPPPPDGQPSPEKAVIQAVEESIARQSANLLAYLVYDTQVDQVRFSPDESWATALLNPVDPQTGEVVSAEPGLAVLTYTGSAWQATLPSDPDWADAVDAAPESLLSPAAKAYWNDLSFAQAPQTATTTYNGYLLPWAAGETLYMTQSVHHDAYTPSGTAHYAFDFAKGGSGMFNLYAARGGAVKWFVDTWENGHYDEDHPNEANYLVLEDTTTNPTTYQLYLHLAQDSIPDDLKVRGATVLRGQFIGIADDTGVSSGNHLHFHVHTSSTSYWGQSVDITFDDVSINGGRPRSLYDKDYCNKNAKFVDVCDSFSYTYVSGNEINVDLPPPTGDLLSPLPEVTVQSASLHLEGWAQDDDVGLASAQFIALYNGAWREVGSAFTTSLFSMDWNLCASQVPDGPLSLALRLKDINGNQALTLPGLRHLTKNYTCPPPDPVCVPTANQVALFSDPDYQGECVVLGIGSFNSGSLGEVGTDNAESIQVGANVEATLYDDGSSSNPQRADIFTQNDSNLADNRIGVNRLSFLEISADTANTIAQTQVAPISLAEPNSASALAATVLLTETVESGANGWTASGLWQRTTADNRTPGGAYSWRYGSGTSYSGSGSLTSPSISLPAGSEAAFYLRFYYANETEGSGIHWDQRWVQISTDDGAHFTNLLQLSGDQQNFWLQSPAIDLSDYAGQDVRIGFYFEAGDTLYNSYKGWRVDDISLTTDPPPACTDAKEPNDSASTAALIAYNTTTSSVICPGGDVDYYRFEAEAGDQVGADLLAQSAGSALDSTLFLLDSDGASVLASNDDQVAFEITDSALSYTLPRDGTYYLKLQAWDHPSAGGGAYTYSLRLFQEAVDPSGAFRYPHSGAILPDSGAITMTVTAADAGSGLSHVEFLWHSSDWQPGQWISLGEDWDSSDGWSYPFDLSALSYQVGLAFYAKIYDRAGNWIGTGAWDLSKPAMVNFLPAVSRLR